MRKTVASMLQKAARILPRGYKLRLLAAYRTPREQEKRYDDLYGYLRRKHRSWSKKELEEAVAEKIFPPSGKVIAGAITGGAVEVGLVAPSGRALEMRNRKGDFYKLAETRNAKLTGFIEKNRKILIEVMTKAGFVNYPLAWWLWSYGDAMWALQRGRTKAIYGPIEPAKEKAVTKQLRLLG